jgi:uncharacterized CHY-type Zn-finger protein
MVWLLVVMVSVRQFGPREPAKGAKRDTSRFKFLHCDHCKMEMAYNQEMDGKRCPKCQPPNTGFFIPTETSVKSGLNALSPWSKVYVSTFVETVIMLGVLTFLLYRPVPDPKTVFFVVICPYCNQRLRYRSVSHGGLGSCSRCKRMLRFPAEEDAVTEEDVLRADEATAMAEFARAEAEEEATAAEEEQQ